MKKKGKNLIIMVFIAILLVSSAFLLRTRAKKELTTIPSPIAASAGSYYAVNDDGDLVCWGENAYPDSVDYGMEYAQRRIVFENVTSVWTSRFSVLILDKDKNLWSSSGYFSEQIGRLDSFEKKGEWTQILSNVCWASSGLHHNAAVTKDGDLWTWGMNDKGQLGNGAISEGDGTSFYPREIMGGVKTALCSDNGTYALSQNGVLYAWGEEIGTGKPTMLSKGVESIAFGCPGYLAMLSKNGDLYFYNLQDSSVRERIGPIRKEVINLFNGAYQTSTGETWLWGLANEDELLTQSYQLSLSDPVLAVAPSYPLYLLMLDNQTLCYVELFKSDIKIIPV